MDAYEDEEQKAGRETSLLRRETLIKLVIFSAPWSKGSLFIEQLFLVKTKHVLHLAFDDVSGCSAARCTLILFAL